MNTLNQSAANLLDEALIPGNQVEATPEQAEALGAFEEDALSFDDALESSIDMEIQQ
jgi:hypothetical protein